MTQTSVSQSPIPLEVDQRLKKLFGTCPKGYAQEVRAILKQYPAIAYPFKREHSEWHPLFASMANKSEELVKLFLENGSTPSMRNRIGGDVTAVEYLLRESYTPPQDRMLRLLLDHPECNLGEENDKGRVPAAQLNYLLQHSPEAYDSENWFSLIRRILHDTPDEKIPAAYRYTLEEMLPGEREIAPATAIAHLRMWAERGVDINDHVTAANEYIMTMLRQGQRDCIPALIALGLDKHRNQVFSQMPLQAEFTTKGRALLQKEIDRCTQGAVSPEELLFTPENRPTWQAIGLVTQGMADTLFTSDTVKLFGSEEKQREIAMRLQNVLKEPVKGYFGAPAMLLRDVPLSQPDHSTLVSYASGASLAKEIAP